jgi:ribosomal protein L7Ae-like RNA K-turn-binding protein
VGGILGLARRAGRLVVGDQGCRKALAQGRARLIILATDGSERTQKTFRELGKKAGVSTCRVASKAELGRWLGRDQVAVAAITDDQLVRKLKSIVSGAGDENTRG